MYFYNYKNNKRTNSKFNKVFATRRHFDVWHCFFFPTSLAIFGKIELFSSRLSRFATKKFEIFASQTDRTQDPAKGGTTEGVVAKHAKKWHAVSGVTRDKTKILSQLTICLKAETWPK